METIGITLLVICVLAWDLACLWGVWFFVQEREPGLALGVLFLALFSIGATLIGFAEARGDNANPCIAWGPPQTSMVWAGKVMVPTTYTPCIRRQNEVEK